MLIEAIIFFLGLAIVFYVLFGGADFGAGILEIISGPEGKGTVARAIGPVWEANHVWLILVVVILFMGFPRIYSTISLYLHIPILIMLLGIVLRGTAFAFMHYDAIQGKSNKVYDWVFRFSSVLAPFFLGVVVGAVVLGKIDSEANTFWEGFISPWLNVFSFSVGLFVLVLFTFLAAVYLIGETKDEVQAEAFTTSAKTLNAVAVATGILVFTSAETYGLQLFSMFIDLPFALSMVALTTFFIPLLFWLLQKEKATLSRFVAAGQVICVLLAWFWVQLPVVVRQSGNVDNLTFYNSVAPDATLWVLLWALIAGSCIILPSLFYLMKVFKGEQFGSD